MADILISDEMRDIFQWIFYTFVCQFLDVFGTMANIINIVCFVKQGFKDPVNVSLLALAISDLGCLITLIWANICFTPAFRELDLSFEPIDVQYLTGSWPHAIFTRVSSCITASIALERCLCITIPLKHHNGPARFSAGCSDNGNALYDRFICAKDQISALVKTIVTSRRVAFLNVCIFVVLLASVSPIYCVNSFGMKFSQVRNRTIFGLIFVGNRRIVEKIALPINNVIIPISSFLVVIVCTITLVISLKMQSKWRQKSTNNTKTDDVTKIRDHKLTKMIVAVASIFIISNVPLCVIIIALIAVPDLAVDGNNFSTVVVVCSLAYNLDSFNSAVNIFIYYRMSTKYRSVFRQCILGRN